MEILIFLVLATVLVIASITAYEMFQSPRELGQLYNLNNKLKNVDDSVKLMYESDLVKGEMVQDLKNQLDTQKNLFTAHIQKLERTVDTLSKSVKKTQVKKELKRKAN